MEGRYRALQRGEWGGGVGVLEGVCMSNLRNDTLDVPVATILTTSHPSKILRLPCDALNRGAVIAVPPHRLARSDLPRHR